jgi:hypothetical protein
MVVENGPKPDALTCTVLATIDIFYISAVIFLLLISRPPRGGAPIDEGAGAH